MTTAPAAGASVRPPRGIRNNNPGNIRHGADWQGRAASQPDPDFVTFVSPQMGLRALMRLLLTYQRKHNLRTPRAIIGRWAPPNENNTDAYVAFVAQRLAVTPDAEVDVTKAPTLIRLARAITVKENGRPPAGYPADWYSDSEYQAAAVLALTP